VKKMQQADKSLRLDGVMVNVSPVDRNAARLAYPAQKGN
jgi:hypothetical protein